MGHINPSILGMALFLYGGRVEWILYSLMIPEGVGYHAYPNKFLEISPYVNPLGAEINLTGNSTFDLSCSIGMTIHFKPIDEMTISPNLGTVIIYKTGETFPVAGISLDYRFE